MEKEQWQEGTRIPTELELSKQFNVSRPVLREALVRLRNEGYIESRRGAGSFIRKGRVVHGEAFEPASTVADLVSCLEFRLSVEADAAFYAAQRRSAAQLTALRAAVAALEGDIIDDDFVKADFTFHLTIAEATGNSMYASTLMLLQENIRIGMRLVGEFPSIQQKGRIALVRDEHERIFTGIERGDRRGAYDAMVAHLGAARQRLLGYDVDLGPKAPRT